MFDFLAEGSLVFWVIIAIGWVLVKLFEVKPSPFNAPVTFPRVDFDPNVPMGIHDHFTILESFRNENLRSIIRLRNDVTGQVVTIADDDEHAARVKAFRIINQWRDSDFQKVV